MYEKVATISCILSSIMWRALPGVYGMHSLYIQQQRGYKTETHVKGTTATSNTFLHVQRRTANFEIHVESTWIRCMNMVTKARNRCLPLLRTSKPKSRGDLVEPTDDTEPLKRVWSCIGSMKKFGNTSSVLDNPGRNNSMFEYFEAPLCQRYSTHSKTFCFNTLSKASNSTSNSLSASLSQLGE